MEHRGEIIEKAVRMANFSITRLAERLGKSRRWMYLMFENPHVSFEIILEIGNIIHYDFSGEIKNLNKATFAEDKNLENQEKDLNYWREKYYKLLEEFHEKETK